MKNNITAFKQAKRGFTIVELLIVIVVIAILAAITIVAFNGLQQRAQASMLQSDLTNAKKQVELYNADNGSYPTVLPAGVKPSAGVALSLSQATNGYCINAELLKNPTVRWYYDSAAGLDQGACSGQVISGSESGVNPNLVTNTSFSSGWMLQMQTSTGRTLTNRPGTTGDPYPTRPVLVLTNSAVTTTTYAVIGSTAVNQAAVVSGKNYTRSYYVRKTGPYASTLGYFGLLDGNGLNQTLSYTSAGTTISTDWQKITMTSTALQNAPSTNQLYLAVPTNQFTTSGWTLEFQGFEMREQ